jgi:uncharacterized phage-associated protein
MAAKRLCEQSGWRLTNLQLQKILYLAHMIALGRSGGNDPLVGELFEAWDYGPVLPSVYRRARVFGSGPVRNVFHGVPDIDGTSEADALDEAFRAVGQKRPAELVSLTHWEEGAWAKNYKPGYLGVIIPNEDVLEEYKKRVVAHTA